ncbi:Hypothetical protein NTJ_08219 [Nesidiocoris tenuis]|uniref:Uncharacterized protein n=1 Tax=Nesidiocoris tenuis TaxID=355587 RepID=A0ABN7AT81_9HEMI|nr:Hypothetical protein NTJ_08219 [Nesidiocoris tenuis]
MANPSSTVGSLTLSQLEILVSLAIAGIVSSSFHVPSSIRMSGCFLARCFLGIHSFQLNLLHRSENCSLQVSRIIRTGISHRFEPSSYQLDGSYNVLLYLASTSATLVAHW